MDVNAAMCQSPRAGGSGGKGVSLATDRVVVIGAGIGGLVAALLMAARGADVTVVEAAERPGGKMREVAVDGRPVDSGPTVFTLRRVFDRIFEAVGERLDAHLSLRPADVLARHAWADGGRLDLFADIERSADAIGAFAGAAEAKGYRAFAARACAVFRTLEHPFIEVPRPSPVGLTRAVGLGRIGELMRITPFRTLWDALGAHFADPRLRQLFGRYATYCGSSPFAAPATLMLVAHVEQEGVWLIDGGMHRLAATLAGLAEARGARIRYGSAATRIVVTDGRTSAVRLATGEVLPADVVICNADVAALADGRFGPAAAAVPPTRPHERSLSAVTWSLAAMTDGFPLARHTVFFSDDYAAEFADILTYRRLPQAPTVYVCAQDRDDGGGLVRPGEAERLLVLVNAPAAGDGAPLAPSEIARCADRTFAFLARCGLTVHRNPSRTVTTTPADFEALFPATGGALYGRASHGWMASFRRPGPATRLPGLFVAGGSTHPGPGVPMAAISGRLAAEAALAALASTSPSRRVATSGGISTA
jgi:1-hydroxycarotenoid 3,4-desaturase